MPNHYQQIKVRVAIMIISLCIIIFCTLTYCYNYEEEHHDNFDVKQAVAKNLVYLLIAYHRSSNVHSYQSSLCRQWYHHSELCACSECS